MLQALLEVQPSKPIAKELEEGKVIISSGAFWVFVCLPSLCINWEGWSYFELVRILLKEPSAQSLREWLPCISISFLVVELLVKKAIDRKLT